MKLMYTALEHKSIRTGLLLKLPELNLTYLGRHGKFKLTSGEIRRQREPLEFWTGRTGRMNIIRLVTCCI